MACRMACRAEWRISSIVARFSDPAPLRVAFREGRRRFVPTAGGTTGIRLWEETDRPAPPAAGKRGAPALSRTCLPPRARQARLPATSRAAPRPRSRHSLRRAARASAAPCARSAAVEMNTFLPEIRSLPSGCFFATTLSLAVSRPVSGSVTATHALCSRAQTATARPASAHRSRSGRPSPSSPACCPARTGTT